LIDGSPRLTGPRRQSARGAAERKRRVSEGSTLRAAQAPATPARDLIAPGREPSCDAALRMRERDRKGPVNGAAHPRGWDGRTPGDTAGPESPPCPPPRVSVVARVRRSPGFGPSLAFPVSQWRVSEMMMLVTGAASQPRRIGFRASAARVEWTS